jgi:hypothetical protein
VSHYVLTRSVYGPECSAAANARRLEITRAVTVRLMVQQTTKDWAWIVAVHPDDPLLDDRLALFRSAGVPVHPIHWKPDDVHAAPWDRHGDSRTTTVQKVAATAYKAPWRSVMESGAVVQTRIDDDDGFTVDALERIQRAAVGLASRRVLMLPEGYRVFAGRYVRVYQANNAMHSLFTPAADDLCVYDYGHTRTYLGGHQDLGPGQRPRRFGPHPGAPAPTTFVDTEPAWLWVRHRDTISGHQKAWMPISAGLRRLFPIDWSAV